MNKTKEEYFEYADKYVMSDYGNKPIFIVFTNNLKNCVKSILERYKISKYKTYKVSRTTLAVCEDIQEKEFTGIVLIFNINDIPNGVIVHEVFHGVYHALDYLGMKLKPSSEESYAYLNEAVYNKCISTKTLAKLSYKNFKQELKDESNRKIQESSTKVC